MSTGPYPFKPDWTLSPGTLLRLELRERGITTAVFAGQTGLDEATITAIFGATVSINEDSASRIGGALGTSAQMWLNAERIYREALARGAKDCSSDYRKEGAKVGEDKTAAMAAAWIAGHERMAALGLPQLPEDPAEAAAMRAAGYDVLAQCNSVSDGAAFVSLASEEVTTEYQVHILELAADLGLPLLDAPFMGPELAGREFLVFYRETPETGPVLSDFRPLPE